MNIKTNEIYKTPQEIFDELLKQVNDPNSELKKEDGYNFNIIEVINNIEMIEQDLESKQRECNEPIRFPSYISDSEIAGDYFNEIFKYCNTENNRHLLLLYLPLITNEKPDKTTLYDYSIYNRTIYEAICDTYINKIYKNYIELKNTLLKVDNISLYRNEYTISFICKLSRDKEQHVLLSNGKIHEFLDIGKIEWQSYKTEVNKYFQNYNILSIGFSDNKLYMQIPCENNTKTNIITSDDDILRVNKDTWTHWIIVKKLNKIKIYKNLEEIKDYTVEYDNLIDTDNKCYTSNIKYDKKTLYIGGIKTDNDNNTKNLNNIISFEGGLRDFRIYEVALEKYDIDNIFISNCTPEKEQVYDVEDTITQQPEYTDSQMYEDGLQHSYSGDRDQYDVTQEPEYNEENGSYTITDDINGCFGIDKKIGYINENGAELRKVCITSDTKPCFKYNSIPLIDKKNNVKICYTNDENINEGIVNINNRKNKGKFNKAKEKLKEENKSFINNFDCNETDKLIFVEDLNRWQCEKTDFSCYDETYNYQLPFKDIANDYECISQYNNGIIINDKNKYEQLNNTYYTYTIPDNSNTDENHTEYLEGLLGIGKN